MTKREPSSLVNYLSVNDSYLKRRQLSQSVGWQLLWGMGVSAVISGDFYGWNFGLAVGGFTGLLLATCLMALMYFCLVYSIAELATAFPHTGGFYSYVRSALGPFWGFVCGVFVAIEYILVPAVIIVGMSGYVQPFVPFIPDYVLWLLAYAVFVALNLWGAELSLFFSFMLALLALGMLSIFYIVILVSGDFDWQLLFNISPMPGQSASWLPTGWGGVIAAIPYAIWFFLAIEQVPLAAEETKEPERTLPRALVIAMFTLLATSLLTLVLNTGVGGGAEEVGKSNVPLQVAMAAYTGQDNAFSSFVSLVALCSGLLASFHAVIFAYGRILFALSRAGYIPQWLSVTNDCQVPNRALIVGAIIGFVCTVCITKSGIDQAGAVLLNMAVFAAIFSYLLVMLSYIKLKLAQPHLQRPYQSPLGIGGAVLGAGLALIALIACFAAPEQRPGLWGVLGILTVAVAYFYFCSRQQLIALAPEERTALQLEQH